MSEVIKIIQSICKLNGFIIHYKSLYILLDNHQPVTGLFAVIAMIIGFILAFFGIRLFRFVISYRLPSLRPIRLRNPHQRPFE